LIEVPVERIVTVKERNYELEQKVKHMESMSKVETGWEEADEWRMKYEQLQASLENRFRVELAKLEVDFRNQINEYESRIASMNNQIEALRNAPPELDIQYMEREKIVQVPAIDDARTRELIQQIAAYEREISDHNDAHNAAGELRRVLGEYQNKIRDLQNQLAKAQQSGNNQSNGDQNQEIRALREENGRLKTTIGEIQNKLNGFQNMKIKYEKQIETLAADLQKTKSMLNAAERGENVGVRYTPNEEYEYRLKQYESRIRDLESRLAANNPQQIRTTNQGKPLGNSMIVQSNSRAYPEDYAFDNSRKYEGSPKQPKNFDF